MKRTTKKLLTLSQTTILRPRMLTGVAGGDLPKPDSASGSSGNGYGSLHR
jgi:hypothetical protein